MAPLKLTVHLAWIREELEPIFQFNLTPNFWLVLELNFLLTIVQYSWLILKLSPLMSAVMTNKSIRLLGDRETSIALRET